MRNKHLSFRSGNPALNANTFASYANKGSQTMTIMGTVNKTALALLLLMTTALFTWNLPAGEPPYRPAQEHNHPTSLKKENRNFSYFVKGRHGDQLPAFKRENIFIGILEGVHPLDAKLVISMINKEKIEGVTRNVVEEAFPGLLKDSKK